MAAQKAELVPIDRIFEIEAKSKSVSFDKKYGGARARYETDPRKA